MDDAQRKRNVEIAAELLEGMLAEGASCCMIPVTASGAHAEDGQEFEIIVRPKGSEFNGR